jgi:small subunit ribosomal protein S20
MPNTKSAERRMRSNVRRHQRNQSAKSRIKTLEKNYLGALASGKKEDATAAYRTLTSALDHSAKSGVVHANRASRKKSRLGIRLATLAG